MKLLYTLKNLILEARVLLNRYIVDGRTVSIFYNDHSNLSVNSSRYGRQSIEEIRESMESIIKIIVRISLEILTKPSRVKGKDHSILVKDYMIGMDYHFWVNSSANGNLFLTINTSIGQSASSRLPKNQNDKTIIIDKIGDTIIRESIDLNVFTKIVRGDIIIYHN